MISLERRYEWSGNFAQRVILRPAGVIVEQHGIRPRRSVVSPRPTDTKQGLIAISFTLLRWSIRLKDDISRFSFLCYGSVAESHA
jgi:hypothetical protein